MADAAEPTTKAGDTAAAAAPATSVAAADAAPAAAPGLPEGREWPNAEAFRAWWARMGETIARTHAGDAQTPALSPGLRSNKK